MIQNMLALIVLSLPWIGEAILDYREWLKDIRDKKGLDVLIRGAGMFLAGIIVSGFTDKTWWQGLTMSVGLYVIFFDAAMGWLLKKDPFFLGTTSKWDMFLKKVPTFFKKDGKIANFLRNHPKITVALIRGTMFVLSAVIYYI